MRGASLLFVVFFVSAAAACFAARPQSQEKPEEAKIPPEAAKRENPVKPTPQGLAGAKRLYGFDCALCHGATGDGKGDLAAQMKLSLKDWRDPATLAGMTDGELFYIIIKGRGKMVGEEGRMNDDQGWQMVNYVRSLVKKSSDEKPKTDTPKQ